MEAHLPRVTTALQQLPCLRARTTLWIGSGAPITAETSSSRRSPRVQYKRPFSVSTIAPDSNHKSSKRPISKHVFNIRVLPASPAASPRGAREFGSSPHMRKPSRELEVAPKIDDPPAYIPSAQNNSEASPVGIRNRLRIWEAEHADIIPSYMSSAPWKQNSEISNSLTRPEDASLFLTSDEQDETYSPMFTMDELMDFGHDRQSLRRGDLVELRSSARIELAIFVRNLESQSQFYSMSGKWMHQRAAVVKFSVPNFVKAEELDCLLPYLPDSDVAQHQQNKLIMFENALPRTVGAPLVTKMVAFWKDSDLAYRSAAARLDNAHNLVARSETLRYATLDEIARELLPDVKLTKAGNVPRPLLYAVHRSVMQDPLGFRTKPLGNHRAWQQYEISSMDDYNAIVGVCGEVRRYQEYLIASSRRLPSKGPEAVPTAIEGFIAFLAKAQRLIDRSRKTRQLTADGIIGPAKMDSNVDYPASGHMTGMFDSKDLTYLRFIESWAALRTFDRQTSMHAIGSTILRATGRYDRMTLDESIAWTFLQEIGAITPWENRAAFDLRLRNTARNLHLEEHENLQGSQQPRFPQDSLANLRKNWGDLPIYCIDGADAHEIDDGVSIEPTDMSDEYWIHVHVADPTSQIEPGSILAKKAEILSQSVYFPDRFTALLPSGLARTQFSLAPHRPCLTVSIKMNSSGQILDEQITAGTTGKNVVYLTPGTLDEVIGSKACKETVIAVGPDCDASTERNAPKVRGSECLSEADKENLRSLCKLAKAYHDYTSQRGRIILMQSEKTIFVDFSQERNWHKEKKGTSFRFHTDPRIELRVKHHHQGSHVHVDPSAQLAVTSLMILASETAAKWCHDRGVPIIFRATERNPDVADPVEFFGQNFLPFIGKQPPEAVVEGYMKLVGHVLPTSSPGPHVPLGIEMYAKFTSPLRRYGDLVAHWQVNAALREELRLGKSLVGSTRTDYLPFSKENLDQIMPRLHTQEKAIQKSSNRSRMSWTIQLLLRAWKFKEAPLPSTWEFIVSSVYDGKARGVIADLGTSGIVMPVPKWTRAEEVQKGDVFEVELEALNPYTPRFQVKGLFRKKPRTAKENNEL